jgi:hypothetical protein
MISRCEGGNLCWLKWGEERRGSELISRCEGENPCWLKWRKQRRGEEPDKQMRSGESVLVEVEKGTQWGSN